MTSSDAVDTGPARRVHDRAHLVALAVRQTPLPLGRAKVEMVANQRTRLMPFPVARLLWLLPGAGITTLGMLAFAEGWTAGPA